jgi:hypothetical protein
MKIIIFFALMAIISIVKAGPFEIRFQQEDGSGNVFGNWLSPNPNSGTTGIYSYDGSSRLVSWLTIGAGLTVSNGALSAPTAVSAFTNDSGYITSSALSPYLTSATAASTYATKSGTTAQYIRGDGTTATFPTNVSSFTNDSAYINQSGARSAISLTTTGSGAASYNNSTGVLNVPTPASVTPFNFSQPSARTINVSTSYQATDNTKAAIIYPSYACQNATQVLASSACTLQVRIGTGALTCSTGTVYYTQSLTVNLGVLITQNSTNPVPIFLPSGGSFILCPQTGTFTVTAVEQTAG